MVKQKYDGLIEMSDKPSIREIKRQTFYFTQNGEKTAKPIPDFWVREWLLFVLGRTAIFLITDDDYCLTQEESQRFMSGICQMQQGTPLAYLLGYQEFWSLRFLVNEHTLIPRPDTEVLVEQVLAWLSVQAMQNNAINTMPSDELHKNSLSKPSHTNELRTIRILDLGTGTGCIAISLAHELSKKTISRKNHKNVNYQIVAVDKSAEALKIAKQNANNHHVSVECIESDWFSNICNTYDLENKGGKFTVIVSNPPYIDGEDEHLAGLTAEPLSALVADNHGLADIERIAKQAVDYLEQGGLLALEHGYNQGQAVREILMAAGFEQVRTVQDYHGQDRVTLGNLGAVLGQS